MDVDGYRAFEWEVPAGSTGVASYWMTGVHNARLIRLRGLSGVRRLSLRLAAEEQRPEPDFVLDLEDAVHLEVIDHDSGLARVRHLQVPRLRSAGVVVGFWSALDAPVLEEACSIRITRGPLRHLRLPALRKVEVLEVVDCPDLESIELGELHAAQRVTIRECPNLQHVSMRGPMRGPRLQLQRLPSLRTVVGPPLQVERAYAVHTPNLDGPGCALLAAAGPPPGARFARITISGEGKTWSDDNADGFNRVYVLEYNSPAALEEHVARARALARASTSVHVEHVEHPMDDIYVQK